MIRRFKTLITYEFKTLVTQQLILTYYTTLEYSHENRKLAKELNWYEAADISAQIDHLQLAINECIYTYLMYLPKILF